MTMLYVSPTAHIVSGTHFLCWMVSTPQLGAPRSIPEKECFIWVSKKPTIIDYMNYDSIGR